MQFTVTIAIGLLSLLITYYSYSISQRTDTAIATLTNISASVATILYEQQYVDFKNQFAISVKERTIDKRMNYLTELKGEVENSESYKNNYSATIELAKRLDVEIEMARDAQQTQTTTIYPFISERICFNSTCTRWIIP